MIEKKKVYKCEKCGNIVESLWNGKPSISCCGQEMTELTENTQEVAKEKHLPVIEKDGNKVTVKVGEVEHPMTDEHYILFIEIIAGNKVYRKDLTSTSEKPEAVFYLDEDANDIKAREFCNVHGFHSSTL